MRLITLLAASALAVAAPLSAAAVEVPIPAIPYTRFVLPNGLTVVVSEDHKAPVVAVSVWYHVGSAQEPPGKTGFAHLFEHLMFQGSENYQDEFFKPFEQVGATDQNGTASLDRTTYFETVPTTALDMALWMESDRMGHLLGAIGQASLDEQRGVVQNEKRQRDNQPYGRVFEYLEAYSFPANHPYHHPTIGSIADLNAASLADVKDWFKTYYGAANATVVLVGDITAEVAKPKMLKYFGNIPAGPPVPELKAWVAPREAASRGEMTDDVAQVRIYREWNVPPLGDTDLPLLDLAAVVLGSDKTSRLYHRLVYQDKLADDVSFSILPFELASMALMQVDVKRGVDPMKVEAAIADEWQTFLKQGPSADELARAKTAARAGFIRQIEKVGGFGGKAVVLAEGQVYEGNPTAYLEYFERIAAAIPESVTAAARKWLGQGAFTLTVVPGEKSATAAPIAGRPGAEGKPAPVAPPKHDYTVIGSAVDRSAGAPEVTQFPDLRFPKLQHGKLRNGIEVVLAERHAIPVVQIEALFDAGYAADRGRKLGTASFTMAMLDEGTDKLDSIAIAKQQQRLGAEISTSSTLDSSNVYLNALKGQLDPSLELFAQIIRQPAFRNADIERIRDQWLATIAQEKTQPMGLALRTLPPLLYDKGHAYAIPFTGSGTEASIALLTADDMRAFMRDYIRAENATILVAGDTTLNAIIPKLNAALGDWPLSRNPVPDQRIPHVERPEQRRLYLIERPGSPQTLIVAGLVAPSTKAENYLAIETMNEAFGGKFTSRLNMNLREDKHWAYGAHSFLQNAVGQRPFFMYAPVQTDKTAESIAEMLQEAKAVVGSRPLSSKEIDKVQRSNIRSLPGAYETAATVLKAMADIEVYDRPDNYVETLKSRIEAQTDAEVRAAAEQVIEPDALTFVIVGDLAKIEKPIRALDVEEIKVIDVDGTAAYIGVPRVEDQRRPRTSKTMLSAIRPFGSRSMR